MEPSQSPGWTITRWAKTSRMGMDHPHLPPTTPHRRRTIPHLPRTTPHRPPITRPLRAHFATKLAQKPPRKTPPPPRLRRPPTRQGYPMVASIDDGFRGREDQEIKDLAALGLD